MVSIPYVWPDPFGLFIDFIACVSLTKFIRAEAEDTWLASPSVTSFIYSFWLCSFVPDWNIGTLSFLWFKTNCIHTWGILARDFEAAVSPCNLLKQNYYKILGLTIDLRFIIISLKIILVFLSNTVCYSKMALLPNSI